MDDCDCLGAISEHTLVHAAPRHGIVFCVSLSVGFELPVSGVTLSSDVCEEPGDRNKTRKTLKRFLFSGRIRKSIFERHCSSVSFIYF